MGTFPCFSAAIFGLVRVDARHRVPNRRQANTRRESDIASSDNRDLHLFYLSGWPKRFVAPWAGNP